MHFLKTVALAGAVLAMTAAGGYAQSASGGSGAAGQGQGSNAAGVESVTVTGIVGSLERTIDTKRSSTAIVDAISAEDVGKFPDNNVAESLQRVTGVEITRDTNGEGQYVSVRGLPTDFSLITLNGVSVSSITHQPDNSGGSGGAGVQTPLRRSTRKTPSFVATSSGAAGSPLTNRPPPP